MSHTIKNAIIDAIGSRFSLLLSANLFVYLFVTIVCYAICNSTFPSKVNKFIINYRLLYKFMFEYDKNKHDEDSRELNELFEKLLTKIQELFEKNRGNPIMNEGWCNLDKKNIIRSRRSRTELNYCEEELEEDKDEELEEDEEELEEDEEELEEDEDETEYTDEVITNGEIGINEILGSTVTEDEDNDNKESTEDEDETYIKV
jgi:hypothetical protein